jgi:hypothetical protein
MKCDVNVVLIHGIKTRQDDYEHLCNLFRAGIDGLIDAKLTGVYWGDLCLNHGPNGFGKSFPHRSPLASLESTRSKSKGANPSDTEQIDYSSFLSADAASTALSRIASNADFVRIQEHAEVVASKLFEILPISDSDKTDELLAFTRKFVENRCSYDIPFSVEDLLSPLAAELLAKGIPINHPVHNQFQSKAEMASRGNITKGFKLNSRLAMAVIDRILPSQMEFISDVLRYFGDEGAAISARISDEIERHLVDSTEPILIVGHSLGGVIAYRCLSKYLAADSLPLRTRSGASVSFLTVGSQIGFLREIGFLGSLSRARNSFNWVNIFSPGDFLSSRTAPFFDCSTDVEWETESTFPASHSEYFIQQGFYEWIANHTKSL